VLVEVNFFGTLRHSAIARLRMQRGAAHRLDCRGVSLEWFVPVEADIVSMEAQSFGWRLRFAGRFARIGAKESYLRQMPGRWWARLSIRLISRLCF